MTYAFPLDPFEVLEVSSEATLEEIQTAFRNKSRRYHPDVGGDAWAFRVLVRCYELLSTARVMGRAHSELLRTNEPPPRAANPTANPTANPFETIRPTAARAEDGGARAGARDSHLPPDRLVAVEMLLIRYEMETPLGMLATPSEDRNLSCTLHFTWPPRGTSAAEKGASQLRGMEDAFHKTMRKSHAISGWSRVDDGAFQGWLTYSSAVRADEAFRMFRASISKINLGVEETIRDITIPRHWSE